DGSEEQKQKWLPQMARFEKIGCFGLTEPLVGSGASGGLLTTAKREGDTWILNGEKRWIGNAPWCDLSIIWARDLGDNQVKGFIVENKTTPGFSVEKIENKIALKVVQNGHITLKDVRVPETNRLQGGSSFRDTAKVLKMTRFAVAWMATGCAMGAYETALKYAQERLQFGKPIGSFQALKHAAAEIVADVEPARAMLWYAAYALDTDAADASRTAAMAKARLCDIYSRGTARAVLMHGGIGFTWEHDMHLWFKRARFNESYFGSPSFHRERVATLGAY
ncbi:acyl-CoA dehydrogenase family protein, partial [Candidatus Binatus sp.]|uniref:acyl-CoA dehydrogenase family protein n=1 Tax=Candidatus Binatus sp. TaxID=2811406 RepID=UPI003C92D79A